MWFIYQEMLSSFVSRAISSETILIIIDLYHLSAYYRSTLLD